MKRSGNPKIKIIAATSMVIFSLAAAFSGAYAWFNSVSLVNSSNDVMEIQPVSGNFKSLKIYQSVFADENGAYFSKEATQTVTIDNWTTVKPTYSAPIALDRYSPLHPTHPVLMVFEYYEAVAVTTSNGLHVKARMDEAYFLGEESYVTDPQKQLKVSGNPLSSVVKASAISYPSLDSALPTGNYEESNYYYYSAASIASAQQHRFVTITDTGYTLATDGATDFFAGVTGTTVQKVAIILDYYPESLEYIYNVYLNDDVLNAETLGFVCDWNMVV